MNITPEQALANLIKVTCEFVGTRNDHAIINESLRVIGVLVENNAKSTESKP